MGCSVQQASILSEGQGYLVDVVLIAKVEQVGVLKACDIQGEVEHIGLEMFVQVHSYAGSCYCADNTTNQVANSRYG